MHPHISHTPPKDLLHPEACLNANLRRANRLVSQWYARSIGDIGLEGTQFTMLATISGFGRCTLGQLAAWMGWNNPRRRDLLSCQFAELVAEQDLALHALEQFADGTRDAFLHAETTAPDRRIVHAYFGSLPLLTGWRLLSAHTRHHAP